MNKPRILIVTNSIPLPETDFLKYKVIGLSKVFDLHLLCWDTPANKKAFLAKYPDTLASGDLHLYTVPRGPINVLRLCLQIIVLAFRKPAEVLSLISKIRARRGSLKEEFWEFLLYAPLLKIAPEMVHFEYGTLAESFKNIKDYFSLKVSTSFRGYDLNYIGLDNPDYLTKVWNTFDGFHFLGNDLRKRAIKRGYNPGKVEALISPAVDVSVFVRNNSTRGTGKFIVLSTSRLTWKKGLEYGVRAIAILKNKGIPVEYRIIGAGEYSQAIQFAVFELGLQNEVILLGNKAKDEIIQQLQEASAYLQPSVSEGFCNAVVEAQAMGLPVVASDADGLAENISDGETGFVVPKWDVDAMAEKLEWIWNNQTEAKQMGANGMARAHQSFRIEDQINKFVEFYRRLHKS